MIRARWPSLSRSSVTIPAEACVASRWKICLVLAIALQSDAPLPVLDDVAEQGVGEDGLGFTVRDCARWGAKTIREGLAAKPD